MIFQELQEQWRNSWTKRPPSERRVIGVVAGVVLSSIVYLLGIEPAMRNRAQLEKGIPQLKQNAARMNDLVAQYTALSKNIAEGVAPITRELLEQTLQRRNIKTQSLSATNEYVRVQANVANYASVMEWLLEMQKAARLTVEEIKITALTEPGQVSVVITLKQQRTSS